MTRRVALATATTARARDTDLPLLAEELSALGVEPVVAAWDDPGVPWHALDAVVIRSTWDYVARRDEFLDWATRVAASTPVWNPPPVLTWNTDKRYLFDLAGAGLPIIPTRLIEPGDPVEMGELERSEVVVKPAVSAGAKHTDRYPPGRRAAALAHVRSLLDAGRPVLVQPYQPSVDATGERALVHIEGRYSHTLVKGPILRAGAPLDGGRDVAGRITAGTPTLAERSVAADVVALVTERFGTPLYARVDLVDGPDLPRILEVELSEPSLFHAHAPGSAARFAEAIVGRADPLRTGRGRDPTGDDHPGGRAVP